MFRNFVFYVFFLFLCRIVLGVNLYMFQDHKIQSLIL